MNTKILKSIVFMLLIAVVVATPLGVRAQTEFPPSYYNDDLGASRATEIAVKAISGDCSNLPNPSFEGLPRNMTLNEDTTRIVVYHDEQSSTICVLVWGSWPGTINSDGISEFDSKIRVYRNDILVASQDKQLIRSNPATNGVPFHKYTWKVPCGSGEFYMLIDYFQQQILGDLRLGMPHRDWSGIYRANLCRIFLPIITSSPPPPVTPTCPTNWKLRAVSPNDGTNLLSYTESGETVSFVYQMTPEQVFKIYIEKDGVQTKLVNGETTLKGPDRVLEFGNSSYIELKNLEWYTYTLESSFITEEGLRCWNHFQIYDPPATAGSILIK